MLELKKNETENTMQTIKKVAVAKRIKKCKLLLPLLLFISLFLCGVIAHAEDITERLILDAILGKTPADLNTMDLNKDGKVDAADLVYFKNHGSGLHPLLGEHVGTMYRDNAALLEGARSSIGQIPFVLQITNDSPLAGQIDNSQSNGSLYFPKQRLQVTFKNNPSKDLDFTLTFETVNPNVAPDGTLARTITFSGSFADPEKRLMSGTYIEEIVGFKDSRGSNIAITLTGQFTLVLNRI